ncbi:MAG: arylsulfatase, partial [Gammaproteobacteria bacterium]
DSGLKDNTLILFLSDNGAEGHDMERYRSNVTWVPETFDNSLASIGSARSYVALGTSWARAINAPLRDSKGRLGEGGTRVPAFVSMTGLESRTDDAYVRIMDVAPTFLELAGADAPPSMMGRSFLDWLQGGSPPYLDTEAVAAEIFGRRMARRGDWKILLQEPPLGSGDWQLYNLATDLGEQHDLSAAHPEIRAELIAAWEVYAADVGVILPETPIEY